jgi:hypothetical protein
MDHCQAMVCATTDRGPKPCFETLKTQTDERVELYGKFEFPGGDCSQCATYHLKRGRAGELLSLFCAEDIKRYFRDIEQEEEPKRSGGCGGFCVGLLGMRYLQQKVVGELFDQPS